MFIHYLKLCCSIIVILSLNNIASATVAYKWLDDTGQVNFTQHAPNDREVDIIETRPGPKTEPADSQKAVDQILEQQAIDNETKIKQQLENERKVKAARINSKNCDIAKNNLQKYQDNPSGRTRNANGEYIRVNEVDRQNKMQQLKLDIKKYCH